MSLKINIGDKVENFTAPIVKKDGDNFDVNETFKLHSISNDYIVLYFYPRDATPGCTTQAVNLTGHFKELENKNITIIGISKDSIESHKKFIDKKEIPFWLLSDENTQVCEQFGVYGDKKFMGKSFLGIKRTTFVLNSEFKVIGIIEKPKVKEHSKEILEIIEEE